MNTKKLSHRWVSYAWFDNKCLETYEVAQYLSLFPHFSWCCVFCVLFNQNKRFIAFRSFLIEFFLIIWKYIFRMFLQFFVYRFRANGLVSTWFWRHVFYASVCRFSLNSIDIGWLNDIDSKALFKIYRQAHATFIHPSIHSTHSLDSFMQFFNTRYGHLLK